MFLGLVPVKRTYFPVNKGLESLIFRLDFKNVCNGLINSPLNTLHESTSFLLKRLLLKNSTSKRFQHKNSHNLCLSGLPSDVKYQDTAKCRISLHWRLVTWSDINDVT